jgi:hypothetical protein
MADPESQGPNRRGEELLAKMLDHKLTDAEHGELMEQLKHDPSLRAQYVEAISLHSLLRESASHCDPLSTQLFGVSPDELTQLTSRLKEAGWQDVAKNAPLPPAESRPVLGSWARRALAFAAGVLLVGVGYEAWLRPQAAKLLESQQAASKPVESGRNDTVAATPVARLTYVNGCSWGGGSPQFAKLDSQVRLGDEVVLHEGIAEFRLSSGVSINVEGPSALVITSPTSFVLQHGTTTVYVPAEVKDFRLVAASCRITASAAEFGVQVAGGKLDVHAFSGKILATPTIQDDSLNELAGVQLDGEQRNKGAASHPSAPEFTTTEIAAGKGVTLDCQTDAVTVSERHPADESRFATRLTMAGPLAISRAYVDSVLKSKPIGYWRFEKANGNIVPNEVDGLGGLAISGKVYFTKDNGNRAVELGRPGFDGAFYCKNELNLPPQSDYSVESWIKPSHFHNGAIVNMIVEELDGKVKAGFYLQTAAATGRYPFLQSRIRFLHRDPPGGDATTGTNCFSAAHYRLRRWQHVAAVKQGSDMRLYVDGTLVDAKQDKSSLAQHMRIIVGQLGLTAGSHRFIGQIDELAIYSRALTEEEVTSRFKLVDQRTQQASSELNERGI